MPSYPVAFLTLLAGSALAQVSLYIPGADPQPLSANIIGVDDKGHTTYEIHQGILTDDSEGGLPGTATLVEGSDYASWTYVPPGGIFTIGAECSISGTIAVCSGMDENGAIATATDTINPFPVQIGSTIPMTSAPATTTRSATPSPSGMATVLSNSPSQSAQTSEQGNSAPKPTSNAASSNAHLVVPGLLLSLAVIMGVSQ